MTTTLPRIGALRSGRTTAIAKTTPNSAAPAITTSNATSFDDPSVISCM